MEKHWALSASLHQLFSCYSCTSLWPPRGKTQLEDQYGGPSMTTFSNVAYTYKLVCQIPFLWAHKRTHVWRKNHHTRFPGSPFALLFATAGIVQKHLKDPNTTAAQGSHCAAQPHSSPKPSPPAAGSRQLCFTPWTCLSGWWRIFHTMCNHRTKETDPCTRIQNHHPQTASTILAFVVRNSWL